MAEPDSSLLLTRPIDGGNQYSNTRKYIEEGRRVPTRRFYAVGVWSYPKDLKRYYGMASAFITLQFYRRSPLLARRSTQCLR